MKKIAITITFIMILALVLQGVALAALPGTGWQTSYAVMNVGGATGSFTMTAYDKDSATTYASDTFSFDNNEALTYKPGVTPTYPSGNIVGFSTALPSPFQGSVVLSGDVALTSAATLDNLPATGGTAIARYQAVENAATEILFPQVKHNWASQTTTFYVQAAGADAAVTITYTTNDGVTHTQATTIGANKMFIFDPANATPVVASTSCGSDANTSPCFGSAKVVSTSGNIAGVVVEAPHSTSPAAFVLSTRGLTADDKGTTIFAPTVKNYYYDATAGFTVMNTGTSNASVDIELTVTGVQPGSDADVAGVVVGDTYSDNELIQAGKSIVIGPFNNNLGGAEKGIWASMMVTSIDDATYDPQLLVGTSNEAKDTQNLVGYRAKAVYYGYNPENATDELSCPIATEMVGSETGGMSVVNVGDASTTVHFVYVEYNGTTYHFWTTSTLAPGQAIGTNRVSTNPGGKFTNDGSWTFASMANKVYSVYVYTSNGEEIIGLAQEANTTFSTDIRNYECVNLSTP